MNIRHFFFAFAALLLLNGCSAPKVQDYAQTQPKLDLFTYFAGQTQAYGQFQDRSGVVKRRFKVAITGTLNDDVLTLDERFVYDDGEKEQRVWLIKRLGDNLYSGTAGDVIGEVSEEQLRRIQIRETILSHLDREKQLFYKGIKVLSLFFIDEVAKYKQYDTAGQAFNGEYADIFEEEYKEIRGEKS